MRTSTSTSTWVRKELLLELLNQKLIRSQPLCDNFSWKTFGLETPLICSIWTLWTFNAVFDSSIGNLLTGSSFIWKRMVLEKWGKIVILLQMMENTNEGHFLEKIMEKSSSVTNDEKCKWWKILIMLQMMESTYDGMLVLGFTADGYIRLQWTI